MDRAVEEGRAVPLLELPAIHRRVQQSVLRLHVQLAIHSSVAFVLLHNGGTAANPQKPVKLRISDMHREEWFITLRAMLKVSSKRPVKSGAQRTKAVHYPEEILAAAGAGMGAADET